MADRAPQTTIKGTPAFEIARRDARIERLTEALRAIAAGEVQHVMGFAAKTLGYEERVERDYARG